MNMPAPPKIGTAIAAAIRAQGRSIDPGDAGVISKIRADSFFSITGFTSGSQRDALQTKRPQHPLQNFFWHEQHSTILPTVQASHMFNGNGFSRLHPPLQFTRLLLNRLHGVSIHQTFVHRHSLSQNTIVMNQAFIEHHIPCWGNQLFSRRVVPCRNTIANKPSQSWYNDTVVIQKKTVKMGVDVIHCERVSKLESNHNP